MTQRSTEEHFAGSERGDQRRPFPHDAERFAGGLEDDRKLHRAGLIAGVLSEVALVAMLITSLQEPGRVATVVLALLVVGLGLAMGVHVARFVDARQSLAASVTASPRPIGRGRSRA